MFLCVHFSVREINLTTHFTANKFCVIVNLRSFPLGSTRTLPRYFVSSSLRTTTLLFIESGRATISHPMLPSCLWLILSIYESGGEGRKGASKMSSDRYGIAILVSLNHMLASLRCGLDFLANLSYCSWSGKVIVLSPWAFSQIGDANYFFLLLKSKNFSNYRKLWF